VAGLRRYGTNMTTTFSGASWAPVESVWGRSSWVRSHTLRAGSQVHRTRVPAIVSFAPATGTPAAGVSGAR